MRSRNEYFYNAITTLINQDNDITFTETPGEAGASLFIADEDHEPLVHAGRRAAAEDGRCIFEIYITLDGMSIADTRNKIFLKIDELENSFRNSFAILKSNDLANYTHRKNGADYYTCTITDMMVARNQKVIESKKGMIRMEGIVKYRINYI